MEVRSTKRLSYIKMRGPGAAVVREYDFGYDVGPGTGRTILTSVQECAPDHVCKPPTHFWFSGNTPSFGVIKTGIKVPYAEKASPMLLGGDVTVYLGGLYERVTHADSTKEHQLPVRASGHRRGRTAGLQLRIKASRGR
jgi:hypothetical protein